jgi:hypothetical protein
MGPIIFLGKWGHFRNLYENLGHLGENKEDVF